MFDNCRLSARSRLSSLLTLALLIPVSSSSLLETQNLHIKRVEHLRKRSPPPLPAGWTALGCYTDSGNPRSLSARSYSGSNVSAETCSTFCSAYAYAGMEFTDECYCGNTLEGGSTAVASTQCTMHCAGNSQEVCGGPNLLTVLQQTAVPPVASPSTLASYNTWVSLGCYSDDTNGRTLSHATAVTGQVTVESCCNACQAAGYPLAGMEYSTECYCGSSFLNGGSPASSGCTMACAGNSSELCGGPDRLNMYNNTAVVLTTPTFGTWKSIGCYSDNVNTRTLVNSVPVTGPMTVEKCLGACQAANFSFAGLEFRQECHCGNAFVNGGAPVNSGCDMTCAGSTDEICGGADRLSVYNNTAVPDNTGVALPPTVVPEYNGWVSLGCYSDNFPVVGQRAINVGPVGISGPFTVESCIDFCDAHGFALAGVESGNQCFCSSMVGLDSGPVAQGCTLPCQGNTTELCGGSLFLNLYINNYEPPPTVLPAYGTWVSIGCYSSNANFAVGIGFNGLMTAEKCVSGCQGRNFPIAAVSNAGCSCGNANSFASAAPSDTGCILPCFGDKSEICGNEFYVNGYQNTAFGQVGSGPPATLPGYGYWASLGCYSGGALAVDVTDDIGGAMTVEKCVTTCASGLTIAAIQNGNTCHCGDSIPSGVAPVPGGCSTLCAGNSTEFCGGPNAMNVYNYTRAFV